MIGSSRSGDPRVRRLLDELGLRYEVDGDGDFKLILNLGSGRSQIGFIKSNTETYDHLEIREVFSIAYVADGNPSERLAIALLKDNADVKMGAWRLTGPTSQGKMGIIYAAQIAASTDAPTLASILEIVLGKADKLEKDIFGTDNY